MILLAIWEPIVGITSVLALCVAIYSIFYSMDIAKNAAKPYISSWFNTGKKEINLFIKNYGSGPAQIDSVEYFLDDQPIKAIRDCFSILPKLYTSHPYFSKKNKYYIGPGEKIYLLRIEATTLMRDIKLQEQKKLDNDISGHPAVDNKLRAKFDKLDFEEMAIDELTAFRSTIKEERKRFRFIVKYSDTFDIDQTPYEREYTKTEDDVVSDDNPIN